MPEPQPSPDLPEGVPNVLQTTEVPVPQEQALPVITVLPKQIKEARRRPVNLDHPYVIRADPNGPFPECFAVLSRKDFVKYRIQRTPWLGSRTGHLYRFSFNKRTKDRKHILWLHRLVAKCPKNRFVSFKNHDERDLRPNNLRIVQTKPKKRPPK